MGKIFYLKKNLIGFIVGAFLFGIGGVLAVTYFSSSNTIYDNSDSGMTSTNVQDALDELYSVCKVKKAGEQIIENAGLTQDSYECRYFFKGKNVNNYITFNNETAGWRIMSVECDGTIKIVRNNITKKGLYDDTGANDWENTTLYRTLRNYYTQLENSSRQKVVSHAFPIGWSGYIGVPTADEYRRTTSNDNLCGLNGKYNDNYSECNNSNWMYIFSTWWTMDQTRSNNTADFVNHEGIWETIFYDVQMGVRPAMYLSSELEIVQGDGSKSNPYVLE